MSLTKKKRGEVCEAVHILKNTSNSYPFNFLPFLLFLLNIPYTFLTLGRGRGHGKDKAMFALLLDPYDSVTHKQRLCYKS